MDTINRRGEGGDVPFRTQRFFAVDHRWYFSTREGVDSGPYANRERAEEGLRKFLQVAQLIPYPGTQEGNKVARNHRIY